MKNLNNEERERLVGAMQALIDRGRYQELGNIHGAPPTICPEMPEGVCCSHQLLLLPWHRLFMVQMEEELGEPVPYWDWTEDDVLPDLWEGINAPFKKGLTSKCEPGKPFASRSPNITIEKEVQKKNTREAFEMENFREFHNEIAEPHSYLHILVGCEMSVTGTGAYDPIFFLHHSYVDLQFAYWQELQRLRGHGQPLIDEFHEQMPPFDRDEVINGFKNDNHRTLRNNRGLDTLDYRGNFCYEYDQLLFDGMTPAEFLEDQASIDSSSRQGSNLFRSHKLDGSGKQTVRLKGVPRRGKCEKVCTKLKGKSHCKELCAEDKREGALVKVFVGVVLPRVAPSGLNSFDLCQGGKCVKAGKVGTFGSTTKHADKPSEPRIDEKNYYIAETDVTAVMDEQGWTLKKRLVAKMTSSVVGHLPQPVVIEKKLGKGGKMVRGKVILSPKEKRSHYGNLLDKYSS